MKFNPFIESLTQAGNRHVIVVPVEVHVLHQLPLVQRVLAAIEEGNLDLVELSVHDHPKRT